MHPRACRLEALLQRGDVVTELGEVLGDIQCPVGGDKEPLRWARDAIPGPEHLPETDMGAVPLVVEHPEQDREGVRTAQGDRMGGAGLLVAFGLVVTQHIRAQRAFSGLGARGLVVRDPVCRHQQCRHRVDERGLAGADIPGEQGVVSVQVECPHATVERAPVEDLKAVQAETRACHHESSGCSVAAYSLSRRSSSASHCPSTKALRMRRTSYMPPESRTRRRNPRSTTFAMCVSIWSTSRASLLRSGRNTCTISTIWSRLMISRGSPSLASASSSFLRSSASIRLTGKDSDRRATNRGIAGPSASESSSGRERRNAYPSASSMTTLSPMTPT